MFRMMRPFRTGWRARASKAGLPADFDDGLRPVPLCGCTPNAIDPILFSGVVQIISFKEEPIWIIVGCPMNQPHAAARDGTFLRNRNSILQ